jgi:electron transfer flavoprotein beta subunit
MTIAVCLKWALRGTGDERYGELSYADQAALEFALLTGAHFSQPVRAVTAGPPEADKILREAVAVGVNEVCRVDVDVDISSALVAQSLLDVVQDCLLIWCGDYSSDRGSGSVPAFLAAELEFSQALGLISVDIPTSTTAPLQARRRLDAGRREVLEVHGPAVISVEGSAARLRRASLRATMAASNAVIATRHAPDSIHQVNEIVTAPAVAPFRPRPRVVEAPQGQTALDRVRQVTDTASAKAHGETVELEPDQAAERIMSALRLWNYLDS